MIKKYCNQRSTGSSFEILHNVSDITFSFFVDKDGFKKYFSQKKILTKYGGEDQASLE